MIIRPLPLTPICTFPQPRLRLTREQREDKDALEDEINFAKKELVSAACVTCRLPGATAGPNTAPVAHVALLNAAVKQSVRGGIIYGTC